MEAEDRVAAPEEELSSRRPKRRRPNPSATECIDLSEMYSSRKFTPTSFTEHIFLAGHFSPLRHTPNAFPFACPTGHSPRHPRTRLPNPLTEPASVELNAPASPIYIDDEAGPSKASSHPVGNRSSIRLRRQPGDQPSTSRRGGPRSSRWGELNDNSDPEDVALARKLQAEEEMRAARQRRALDWRMEELEREEEAASAAAGTHRGSSSSRAVMRAHRRQMASIQRRGEGDDPPEVDERRGGGRYDGRPFPPTGPRTARRRGWPHPSSMGFADAMAGLLGGPPGEGSGPPSEGGRPYGSPFFSIFSEIAALHQAVSGARNGALPAELLFSDRDFNEDDYEALLALDANVENRQGAAQDVINQLPSERVPRKGENATAYGDCCICMDCINAGQVVRKLECGHSYHKNCVDKWLKQKACCPVCQRHI